MNATKEVASTEGFRQDTSKSMCIGGSRGGGGARGHCQNN